MNDYWQAELEIADRPTYRVYRVEGGDTRRYIEAEWVELLEAVTFAQNECLADAQMGRRSAWGVEVEWRVL